MKNLAVPIVDSVAMVDQLVADRQAGVNAAWFTDLKAGWKTQVQTYLNTHGRPDLNAQFNGTEEEAKRFLTLYGSPQPGHVQKQILEDMRNHGLLECPACGDAGKPGTLDHYLPQSTHPHLAVLPHNLAPMCQTCQWAKTNNTVGGDGQRLFLHPYYDTVIAQQVINLTIVGPYTAPWHLLSVNGPAAGAHSATIENHIRELQIRQRFADYFVTAWTRLLRNVEEMREAREDVAVQLRGFRRRAAHASLNSWDHVFYDGVIENADLMAFLESGKFPDFL
ncbi:hypothetical protein [Brevundimonas naejangsanensis]